MRTRVAVLMMVVGFVAISTGVLRAQAPAETASQFYMAYRAAFDKAAKIEDVLPFMSAAQKKMVEATPADERSEIFGMLKMMNAMTEVKITKEEKAGTGATLTVAGIDSDKKTMKGTIKIVREGNAWKLGEESWSN